MIDYKASIHNPGRIFWVTSRKLMNLAQTNGLVEEMHLKHLHPD